MNTQQRICLGLALLALSPSALAQLAAGTQVTFSVNATVVGDASSDPNHPTKIPLGERGSMSCSIYLPRSVANQPNKSIDLTVHDAETTGVTSDTYMTTIRGTFLLNGAPVDAQMICDHSSPDLSPSAFETYLADSAGSASVVDLRAAPASSPEPSNDDWQNTITDILPASITKLPPGSGFKLEIQATTIQPIQPRAGESNPLSEVELIPVQSQEKDQKAADQKFRLPYWEDEDDDEEDPPSRRTCLRLELPSTDDGARTFPGGHLEAMNLAENRELGLPHPLAGTITLNGKLITGAFLSWTCGHRKFTIADLKKHVEASGGTFILGPWKK